MLLRGYNGHRQDQPMKFYNLPVEVPKDRHKWFYGAHEAAEFLVVRGQRNGMEVLQLEREGMAKGLRRHALRILASSFLHRDVDIDSLWGGSVWAVLGRSGGANLE